MTKPDFVYTLYIQSTPEKVWQALTTPEFTRQYWAAELVSDWREGSPWHMMLLDGQQIKINGTVLKSNPPHQLVMTWTDPEDATDVSQVTYEIEPLDNLVRLSVIHSDFKDHSDMDKGIAKGWPRVLSSLKSFLETGKPLDMKLLKCSSAPSQEALTH